MPPLLRGFVAAASLSLAAASAAAQASPYLPLDDARLPLLEHLIARGDVADPSPMLRPFRVLDALRVLAEADSTPDGPTGRVVRRLRASLEADTVAAKAWWRAEARAGGQAYTQKRRDQLHLGGPRGANPYLDVNLQAVLGPVAGATRPALEPRLIGDPDWPNQAQEHVTGRLIDGYLSAQFRYGSLTYGQLERNWGPVGLPGIPLSDVSYERQGLALELGAGPIKLTALAATLRPEPDSLGRSVNRYYFVHRLEARLSHRLWLALWEGILLQGVGRGFETPFANPLSPSVLANQFGIADTGSNVIIGADATWRLGHRATLQVQAALDDFWFNDRSEKQDRWAFTVAGFGALGATLGWRAWYTQASSLAFRTFNPTEDFTDQGVGIGRNFADMDQLAVRITVPVATSWLLTPEVVLQRQGEGKINDPYPALVNGRQVTPTLFIGTVEHTARLGLGVAGRRGPLDLSADAAFHHVTNDQNRLGVTANRLVGRIQATLAWRKRGALR